MKPIDTTQKLHRSEKACARPKIGEWAESKIAQIETTIRTGLFEVAKKHIDEIAARGLDYDDSEIGPVTLDTFVASVFDVRTAGALEKAGIFKFRELLFLRPEELRNQIPNIGEKTLNHIRQVCWEHFKPKTAAAVVRRGLAEKENSKGQTNDRKAES